MLSKKIEKALNKQIAQEAYASHYYLAMASWCETQNLGHTAGYLYQQSKEEANHMMKLFHYINDQKGHAIAPAVKAPPAVFKSLRDIFERALKSEQAVTKSINDLVEMAFEAKDYGTVHFLQWYVAEQQEEERTCEYIYETIQMIGTKDTRGLYLADKHVGKMVAQRGAN